METSIKNAHLLICQIVAGIAVPRSDPSPLAKSLLDYHQAADKLREAKREIVYVSEHLRNDVDRKLQPKVTRAI